ncbi:hypothetical protein ABFT23_01935 [Nocardioides sp. C4-1]|uniref:hypothetical protein n=1 Tax=Nocardioides sp. C4-1 TaxID=3151851 RepID=UPI0032648F65
MPVSAVNTFALKPHVTAEEFDRFSREVDRPACLALDEVEAFEVYLVDHGPEGSPRVDVIEVMTVSDWPAWERARDHAPALAAVTARFAELVDESTVATYLTHPSAKES